MSITNAEENVNQYLFNAIAKLNSLKYVNVTKKLTSHYSYGTQEPFIRDRFNIRMGLKNYVHCN